MGPGRRLDRIFKRSERPERMMKPQQKSAEISATADIAQPPADQSRSEILGDPEFPLFKLLPLRLVVPVLLVAAAVSWCALAAQMPVAAAAATGAGVVLTGLTPARHRAPRSVAGRVALAIGYRWRRGRDRNPTQAEAFDVPLPEGGSCGMRWDGARLMTMLRIDPPPDALTLLRRDALSTDQVLPLAEIARCLRQFDITLASIDVIGTGSRTAGTGFVAQLYDRIIGPLPAIAQRTVWLVLQLEPLANAGAVDNRGGGSDGSVRSAIAATRRIANRLAARDIAASILTANEMNTAVRQLIHGIPLDELTEAPDSLRYRGLHLTTYEIGAELVNSAGFAAIWATPSVSTTVNLRLRPLPSRPGLPDRPPVIVLDALVRFDTTGEFTEPPVAGLRALPGRQLPTLLETLPIGSRARGGTYRGQRAPVDALSGTSVSTSGCGQLIGADELGQGIAVPLVGDGTRHVEVVGKLDLAQQVVLRAIALGARVVVHTDRSEAWNSMVSNVASPHWLSLAPRVAGTAHQPVAAALPPGAPTPTATVLVYDGIAPAASSGGATILHIRTSSQRGGYFDPDVTLLQDEEAPNRVTVRTSTASATVQMVTTPDEMRYIGESVVATR
ncbi:type VII secretion protein EccE [Nocardia beijingensis]|uniref:type VII secretion protein EccE n=1 Tax=Nocardia beijingensis TaxID=95162 RepID=UPI003323E420